jgi:hypothetical protein
MMGNQDERQVKNPRIIVQEFCEADAFIASPGKNSFQESRLHEPCLTFYFVLVCMPMSRKSDREVGK